MIFAVTEKGKNDMARYIDADAFKAIINEHCKTQSDKAQAYWFGVLIDMQPTANVAPIADTVREMHKEIKDRCIKGGIYPAFVASTIDQIAKEMQNEN